jgi:hypothetical protein
MRPVVNDYSRILAIPWNGINDNVWREQGPILSLFMKKSRSKKSHGTVPFILTIIVNKLHMLRRNLSLMESLGSN